MIGLAYLDPASLAMWLDPYGSCKATGNEALLPIVDSHLFGGHDDVVASCEDTDAIIRRKRIGFASSIWHEKRHFTDLILTNFGALLFRRYFKLYLNSPAIFGEFRQRGQPVPCPLRVCADPVRLAALEIEEVGPVTKQIANQLAREQSALDDEAKVFPSQMGLISVGGQAQLEALAYYTQFFAIQQYFGVNESFEVLQDLGELSKNLRYRWADEMALRLGLLPHRRVGNLGQGDGTLEVVVADYSVVVPLLVASLMSRAWGQTQLHTPRGGSHQPAERLAFFIEGLKESLPTFGATTTEQTWHRLEAISLEKLGRSLSDEIRIDLAHEEQFLESIDANSEIDREIVAIYEDYHTLREKTVSDFFDEPDRFLDIERYVQEVLPEVDPPTVYCSPLGSLVDLPGEMESIIRFEDPESDSHLSKWWWLATPAEKHAKTELRYRFSLRDPWIHVIDSWAPAAKLLLNGRRHRVMLGPELISIEMRLKSKSGVDLVFDAAFAYPSIENLSMQYWNVAIGHETCCDFCNIEIRRPLGTVISPWVFRMSAKHAKLVIEKYGGKYSGFLHSIRDWSHWMLCDRCVREVPPR